MTANANIAVAAGTGLPDIQVEAVTVARMLVEREGRDRDRPDGHKAEGAGGRRGAAGETRGPESRARSAARTKVRETRAPALGQDARAGARRIPGPGL